MHRFLVTAGALVVALSCATVAQPATTFVFKGHGWGHGIGMGQYGAEGQALKGTPYDAILQHYYPGTSLGTRTAKRKVLLASARSSLTLGSTGGFKAHGVAQSFAAGTWTVSATGNGRLQLARGGVVRKVANNKAFEPDAGTLTLSGARYRGAIRLRLSGGKVWALNELGLDAYVRGVVAREMPSSWELEALKAQAVAARSYSLAGGGKCTWFGTGVLCPDTRDQVYGGRNAETSSTNAAVKATTHEVVLSGTHVAATFFFSSSGGKTSSVSDEWGSNQASYPYLVSVADPRDVISPHHDWGPGDPEVDCPNTVRDCVWTAGALKRALGGRAPSSIRDFTVTARNGSSRVATAKLSGPPGAKAIAGSTLRSVLGLRSTWFKIGALRLTGGGTIAKGKRTKLHVLVRNLSGARLQKKVGAGAWQDVRAVAGTMDVRVKPGVTTRYRLRSPAASTASVRVRVPPQPRLAAVRSAQALSGVAAPGEAVQVQRLERGGRWVTVAVALAHADGTWRTTIAVVPGSYRAYVSSDGVVGTSPELTIVAG